MNAELAAVTPHGVTLIAQLSGVAGRAADIKVLHGGFRIAVVGKTDG